MGRLFQFLNRRFAFDNIPSWPLIFTISFPVWALITVSNIFTSLLGRKYLVANVDYSVPGVVQHLLQHTLLYPLLAAGYWLAIKNGFSRLPMGRKIATQLGLSVSFSVLVYPALYIAVVLTDPAELRGAGLHGMFHELFQDTFTTKYWAAISITYWTSYFFGLLLIVSATLFIRLQSEVRTRAELDNQQLVARLAILRGQLGPHFLSNALNTVLAFVRNEPDKAEQAISGLDHLLRGGFDKPPEQIVSLHKELSYVEHYLTIMRLRFEDILDLTVVAPQEALDCGIPDFLLISLLENAFKHGGMDVSGRLTVSLAISLGDRELAIRVENSLPAEGHTSKIGSGIGLSNNRDRLSVLYGNNYRMFAGPGSEGFWRVEIGFPLSHPQGTSA